ncbi:MAG: tRNA (guanosine(46)-N7)-methyltransferase TrmB [Thiobacillaceae bacterium]|jgi:tRNA (guanine-N7-)-methyltransferase
MGKGQQKALAELGPRFILPYAESTIDLNQAFGRAAPKVLEIGFGMGQTTAEIAAANPDRDYLGVEVHTPGVGSLLRLIGEQGLTNIRIIQHDAIEVLDHMIEDASLSGVHIFFPDPWPKKKHHKRRLVQPELLRLISQKLVPGGCLHCATDWEDYASQMLEALSLEHALENSAHGYAKRPGWRPLTKFEQRGMRLGHGVWDLVFVRREA